MRAIIDASGCKPLLSLLNKHHPTGLLCVADKPILHHVLDSLSLLKIQICDLILNHLPADIEANLGEGARWGLTLHYHLIRDAAKPFQLITTLSQHYGEEEILLALGDAIPQFNMLHFPSRTPLLWMYRRRWSGWGVLPAQQLAAIPRSTTSKEIPTLFSSQARFIYTLPAISCNSFYDLMESNQRFLSTPPTHLYFPAHTRESSPGLWLSHGSSLHPSVKITPPVFIGENSQVKKGCQLGPYAIVESHCIIDSRSQLEHTLVMRNSYVGEDLHLKKSIVDHNLLINLSIKAEVEIRDHFILGKLSPSYSIHWPLHLIERLIAGLFLIFALPLLGTMSMSHRLVRTPMLVLPAPSRADEWRSFGLLSFEAKSGQPTTGWRRHFLNLPLLLNIFWGQLHFVGVAPRSLADAQGLPNEWLELYLKAKAGLVTLAQLNGTTTANGDETFAAEVYYALQMGVWTDLSIIWRWLTQKMRRSKP